MGNTVQAPEIAFSGFGLLIVLISIVALAFFCYALYDTMRRVPKEHRQFPAWFIWLFFIPLVGWVFQWIMLPFGIPNTLKKAFATNPVAVEKANTLFKIGLSQMIAFTLSFFLSHAYSKQITLTHISFSYLLLLLSVIAAFVLWIIYWVRCVSFKNQFLKNQ